MGEHYARTDKGELIGPYDTVDECNRELELANHLGHDECLEHRNHPACECQGPVEYRMPLSGTGRAFPRCAFHWDKRLDEQERINRTYPQTAPSDFDPSYAGESWDED
jgi:hypothetical protein